MQPRRVEFGTNFSRVSRHWVLRWSWDILNDLPSQGSVERFSNSRIFEQRGRGALIADFSRFSCILLFWLEILNELSSNVFFSLSNIISYILCWIIFYCTQIPVWTAWRVRPLLDHFSPNDCNSDRELVGINQRTSRLDLCMNVSVTPTN